MNADSIAAAPRPCATGIYPLQAGVALLSRNGTFLHRDDFTRRFITCGTSSGSLEHFATRLSERQHCRPLTTGG